MWKFGGTSNQRTRNKTWVNAKINQFYAPFFILQLLHWNDHLQFMNYILVHVSSIETSTKNNDIYTRHFNVNTFTFGRACSSCSRLPVPARVIIYVVIEYLRSFFAIRSCVCVYICLCVCMRDSICALQFANKVGHNSPFDCSLLLNLQLSMQDFYALFLILCACEHTHTNTVTSIKQNSNRSENNRK